MTTSTTYTVAWIGDAFLAVVPDGEDIHAAVTKVAEHFGDDEYAYDICEDCTLTNEPTRDDRIIFSSPNGSCGFIMVREGDSDVTYDYAVRRR